MIVRRRDLTWQQHSGGLEVVGLPKGRRQELPAVVGVQQPAGDPDADLVRIPDPIPADVTVGAKQLHQIEVRHGGVEHREIVLVSVGHVEVQDARLQRELAAPGIRVALEKQSRIEAGNRQRARRRPRRPRRDVVQLVFSAAPGDSRAHEVAWADQVERGGGHEVHSPSGLADGALEVHDFRVETVAQPLAGTETIVGAGCE